MKYTSKKQSQQQQEEEQHTKKHTIKSIKLSLINNNNNKINYEDVFSNNNHIAKNIVFIKKNSFDIFFSNTFKYPLLIRENLNCLEKPNKDISRANYPDNWQNDSTIPLKNQYTINDYAIYRYYGGSEGHMAPAQNHKLNVDDYYDTFCFSNVIPQNMIMNIGIWNILENWCKIIHTNNKFYNINIFTGCIVDTKTKIYYNALLEKIEMNIPTDMYKIITFNNKDYPDYTFFDIIIIKNKEYDITINLDNNKIDFKKYILSIKSYEWFQSKTGLNIKNLLLFYNINSYNLKSFQTIINLNYKPDKIFKLGETYKIYYPILKATSLKELYNNNLTILEDIINPIVNYSYISLHFYKIRNKLIRDKLLYTKYKSLKEFDLFFNDYKNDLINNYKINNNVEFNLLGINQEDYLNKYYTIIKNKFK